MNQHRPEPSRRELGLAQRAPASLKLALALIVVTGIVLLPRQVEPLYGIPAAILAVLWPLCRMPIGHALRRWLVAECFIAGIALLSLLSPGTWPLVLSALVKSNLCVLTMLLLTWTTPFHEILQQLRRLRMPTVMVTTLALMYRYFPVLAEESRRMQRARAARTFSVRRGIAWHTLGTIIGQLFVRSADRAERIYLAMCARGWK